eukprot:GHVU01029807.1.p1 GENE.GHVU01029807.1~~GHVU01029807.1.p1  ORF type:complete len:121 (-),score=7.13 GHVU01029807.1:195-557(-)
MHTHHMHRHHLHTHHMHRHHLHTRYISSMGRPESIEENFGRFGHCSKVPVSQPPTDLFACSMLRRGASEEPAECDDGRGESEHQKYYTIKKYYAITKLCRHADNSVCQRSTEKKSECRLY